MQKIIQYVLSLVLLTSIGCIGAAAQAAAIKEPRVRFVDPQAVLMGLEEGREVAEALQAEFKTKVDALQKQEADFNAQRAKMNPNEAKNQDAMKALAKTKKDLEIESESLKYEFERKQQELSMQMIDKVVKGTENYVKTTNSCDAILPRGLYVAPEYDITQDIIEFINKEHKKKKTATKFKKAEDKADSKKAV